MCLFSTLATPKSWHGNLKSAESSNKAFCCVAKLATLTGLALIGQTLKTITWDLAGVYTTGLVVRPRQDFSLI